MNINYMDSAVTIGFFFGNENYVDVLALFVSAKTRKFTFFCETWCSNYFFPKLIISDYVLYT